MIEIAQTYSKELAAIAAVLLAFGLNRIFRPRAKLIYSIRHAFTFLVERPLLDGDGKQLAPRQVVNTASIFISNVGIEPAKGLEVTFNWEPQFFNTWPARHYQSKPSANGRYTVSFESLAPQEVVGLELLAINAELPAIANIRSEQSVGIQVAMVPQPIHPRWKIMLVTSLMGLGLGAIGYLFAYLFELFTKG